MKLLEFVMNSSEPFYSTTKMRMGDRMQDPNFTQAVDVISMLIRSCLTPGIRALQQPSPESNHHSVEQHITLEVDIKLGLSPLLTPACFTNDLLLKALPNNDSL
jgi:hypothetical protein